jgi:hypothetical protein
MPEPDPGVPVVVLPEPVDRRVRFGPFPSARDALKFATYAAAGAALAPLVSPFAWIPVLALGFAVSVWRPGGDALDERTARWVLFYLRHSTGRSLMRRTTTTAAHGPVLLLAGGGPVAVIRSSGTPLAYRPPAELAALYDRFREVLRATEGPIYLHATSVPIRPRPVRPRPGACGSPESAARDGYSELVMALCGRRCTRRVDLALAADRRGPEGEWRLIERAEALAAQLAGLGLSPVLLTDRRLAEAVRGFDWVGERDGP